MAEPGEKEGRQLTGGCRWGSGSAPRDQGQEERTQPQAVPGKVQLEHQEEFLHCKGG